MADAKQQKAVNALKEMGLNEDAARGLVERIGEYQALSRGEAEGDDRFKERKPPGGDFLITDQAKVNIVNWLVSAGPDGDLEHQIETSEIPAPMLMDFVMTKTLTDIAMVSFNEDPYIVFIRNFVMLMKGLNRKRVREAIQLYQSGMEMKEEQTSDMNKFRI